MRSCSRLYAVVCVGILIAGSVVGAAEIKIWNASVVAPSADLDYKAQSGDKIEPVRIIATLNGTFSGKVVVGSDGPLRGLRAAVTGFTLEGAESIPAGNVTLGFPAWENQSTYRVVADAISRFDQLLPAPPAEVPTIQTTVERKPVDLGFACQPVWVTVRVPADAKPGKHTAMLTIAVGAKTFRIPVELTVHAWRLPKGDKYRTFVGIVESPESVAMQYKVPFWSPKHFELIGKSFDLLGQVGSRAVYVPLICQTNMGNSQSMVRWIKKPDGTYDYDFTIFDKYLDAAEKHLGQPRIVCLYVWDIFLDGGMFSGDLRFSPQAVKDDRMAYQGKGPIVSMIAPGSNEPTDLTLPQYRDPASKELWKPLLDQAMARLRERGLADKVMLGISTDAIPSPEVLGFFHELLPGVEWAHHSHSATYGGKDKRFTEAGTAMGYAAVVGGRWANTAPGELGLGWKAKWVHFNRAMRDNHPLHVFRILGEMNLTGEKLGFGRLGGDFWTVLTDSRGRPRGNLAGGRYPKSFWRNLNIGTCLLAPGPSGAVPTARFEMLREGVQECEARIFIEQALSDPREKSKLPDALAARAQEILDKRVQMLKKGIAGGVGGLQFNCPDEQGYQGFLASGWQELSDQLYAAAADVQQALSQSQPPVAEGDSAGADIATK